MTALQHKYAFGLLLVIFSWILPLVSAASDIFDHGSFKIYRFTEADGLISSETTDTYKDRNGFLWIATFKGLSRFDGRRFENFGTGNGLTESNVDIVGEDETGQFFIKSITNIYQFTGNTIHAFIKYPSPGKFIIAACPAGKGAVWVAYEGERGLHMLTAKGQVKTLSTKAPVFKLLKTDKDTYVLEYSGKLSILKNNKLTYVQTIHAEQPFTNEGIKVYKDADNTVWSYGANNRSLKAYKDGKLVDTIAVPAGPTAWWQWTVGGRGNVYMASDSGSIFQLIGGQWQVILTRNEIRGHPYEIREDKTGIVWIASSNGLLKLTRKQYTNTSAQKPDHYYATDAKGRYILRKDSLLYTIPNAIHHFNALQSKTLTNVYVTRAREVWYATEEAVYYLPLEGGLQKLNTTNTYEGNKSVFRFRRVMEDGKGGLWISSYHGIFYKKGSSLKYYWNREGLKEGAIYTIAMDCNGVFYAAGVHVYALVNDRFEDISLSLHLPDEITRLTTDQKGDIWICQGTDKVFKVKRAANGRFYKADSLTLHLNGLSFSATSMCFDENNHLWICDNRSLYCYRNNENYKGSALYWNESFSASPVLYADDSNNLQVLSHALAGNFLYTYSATALLQGYQSKVPIVQLTSISLFKEGVDWNKAGFPTNVLGIPQGLVLKHNQNFVRFSFTGITGDFDPSIAYRYRLKGYDMDWSPVTDIGQAEYTGLPADSYTFEVQARSAGGDWSATLFYPFSISEVWYLRWWAKMLWALLSVSLIAGLIYYRGQSLKRKAKVRQLLVEEQLKTLRAQINPHFLQNIFAFLAHELYSSQNVKAVKAIDRLSIYLRNVLKYSDKTAITLEEELEFSDEYLQMQQQLLSIPFQYQIDIDEDVDVFDVQVPSMLLQPLIENAVKYGLYEKGPNLISISVCREASYIQCMISDTGNRNIKAARPFDKSAGKGISLTVERLKLFYSDKKLQPQFERRKNQHGGYDAIIHIPIE